MIQALDLAAPPTLAPERQILLQGSDQKHRDRRQHAGEKDRQDRQIERHAERRAQLERLNEEIEIEWGEKGDVDDDEDAEQNSEVGPDLHATPSPRKPLPVPEGLAGPPASVQACGISSDI